MTIRPKVIITVRHRDRFLLAEGRDPDGDRRYLIPVGGEVQFGEALVDAARRELAEEVHLEATELCFLGFMESHFTLDGSRGHELVFHYLCTVTDQQSKTLPDAGVESDGTTFPLRWLDRNELCQHADAIVPTQVFEHLRDLT